MDPIDVLKLDHTCVCVRDLDQAAVLYGDLLGGKLMSWYEPETGAFATATFRYPNGSHIELMEPIGRDSFARKFLDKHGEGVHHLTFIVADIHKAVAQARAGGYTVVSESYSRPEWMEAFISPRSANGTVLQLTQTNVSLEVLANGVLAGDPDEARARRKIRRERERALGII